MLFWYQNLVLPKILLDFGIATFGIPKVLFFDFSFSFDIDIVQLTFSLQSIFEKDHILNFKIKILLCSQNHNIAQFSPVM